MAGLPNGASLNALIVLSLLLPIAGCCWIKSELPQLVTVICCSVFSPFCNLVGMFLSLSAVRRNFEPMVFAVLAVIYGYVGLVWRIVDSDLSGFNSKYIPLVLFWHVVFSLTFALMVWRMKSRQLALKATIQLELLKIETVKNGASWPHGADQPTGLSIDPVKQAVSHSEIASHTRLPYSFMAFALMLIIFLSMLIDEHSGHKVSEKVIQAVCIPIIGMWFIAHSVIVVASYNGLLGRNSLLTPVEMQRSFGVDGVDW